MSQQHRPGRGRWLLRQWALLATLILLALLAWVVWEMLDAGWPKALRSAPQALLYLGLIAIVWLIRLRGKRWWRRLLGQASQTLRADAREELVEAGRDRLGDTYVQGRQKAQTMVAGLGDKAEEGWQRLRGRTAPTHPAPPPLVERSDVTDPAPRRAQTCPSCGNVTSPEAKYCANCGGWVGQACPARGRALRPGMTFCDGCGQPLRRDSKQDGKVVGRRRRRDR